MRLGNWLNLIFYMHICHPRRTLKIIAFPIKICLREVVWLYSQWSKRGEKHGTTQNHQNYYLEIQYRLGKASYKIMISKPGNMLKLQIVYTIVSLILKRGYTCTFINVQN